MDAEDYARLIKESEEVLAGLQSIEAERVNRNKPYLLQGAYRRLKGRYESIKIKLAKAGV